MVLLVKNNKWTNAKIILRGVYGANWEYLDGRSVRNLEVQEPNTVFTVSEWTIYSNASNSGITNPNTPQNAPEDFNPRER